MHLSKKQYPFQFMMRYFNLFNFNQKVDYKIEILAGLTVAMTMIPESLSFAILAGFPPLVGLYAAFIMGLVTAIFGGRPGLISGGAGATVIVLIALMKSNGLDYVFAAVALAGVFQIFSGVVQTGEIHSVSATACYVWFRKRIGNCYFYVTNRTV